VVPAEVDGDRLTGGPFELDARVVPAGVQEPVEIGVRSEDIVPAGPNDSGTAEGTVTDVEMAGAETFVHATFERESIVFRVPSDRRPVAGARVAIRRTPERFHLFSAVDGKRVGP
jgi:ABC-type sugar transport system ATPase subunit